MSEQRQQQLAVMDGLLRQQRWSALATINDDATPLASMVAHCRYNGGLLFHLSQLAAHTRNLLARPIASLIVAADDSDPAEDPQTLARITLTLVITPIPRDSAEWHESAATWCHHFPAAAERLAFADFLLLRGEVTAARFVGGFAQARSLGREAITALFNAS
jgi:heme iron utilization protein